MKEWESEKLMIPTYILFIRHVGVERVGRQGEVEVFLAELDGQGCWFVGEVGCCHYVVAAVFEEHVDRCAAVRSA